VNRLTCVAALLTSSVTTWTLSAGDGRVVDIRPANVRTAFEALEAAESQDSDLGREGRLGKKIPVMKAISTFRDRVTQRPDDFRSMTVLGQLYIRLAKETGTHAAYLSAEESYRRALKIAPGYAPAKTHLAVSLQAQHRFREALKLATESFAANARDTAALAAIGDCQLHLGQVEEAEASCEKLAKKIGDVPAVLARRAHLAELRGDPQAAITMIEAGRDQVHEAGKSDVAVAWYEARLAALHHSIGHAEDAELHYRSAMKLDQNLQPAKIGLARLKAENGELDLATELFEEAIETGRSAAAMTGLADLLLHRGNTNAAAEWIGKAEEVMLAEARTATVAHRRDLAMFYSDHKRNPEKALKLAKQDLQVREDIYAHDTLAWALHRNGKHQEAAVAIQKALCLGTKDAHLHYHAGMIYAAGGNRNQAVAQLQEALQINPKFDLRKSSVARQRLVELEALADSKL